MLITEMLQIILEAIARCIAKIIQLNKYLFFSVTIQCH